MRCWIQARIEIRVLAMSSNSLSFVGMERSNATI